MVVWSFQIDIDRVILPEWMNTYIVVAMCAALAVIVLSVTQRPILRIILAHRNYLPWKLIPFLDYCADRIFLRKVGGGYIFVHRLLQEHFAAMAEQAQGSP